MRKTIQTILKESLSVKERSIKQNTDQMILAVRVISESLKKGGKVFFFGNGGSAADAQHIAAEFIGRFKKERRSLAAIALTTDTSILTAVGNDYGFERIFSRQIEGLGKKGDVAVGISTSGNSPNVLDAMKKARKMGLKIISMTGCKGGNMKEFAHVNLVVDSNITARIQETHICMAHIICELVEENYK